MSRFDAEYGRAVLDGGSFTTLKRAGFEAFAPPILGLGDISTDAKVINALAAVFDLEGFTSFCGQPDPHLVIPEFLDDFLSWLFDAVGDRFKKGEQDETAFLWSSLPFLAKFMGDGVLFLWDTDQAGGLSGVGNIVVCVHDVCTQYSSEFLKSTSGAYSRTPTRLRAGVARGQVFAIGDGNDCVGPCINIASRLQKLGSLPFAISRRGFNPEKCLDQTVEKSIVVLKTPIRGVGDDETIIAYKSDFDALPDEEKALFSTV